MKRELERVLQQISRIYTDKKRNKQLGKGKKKQWQRAIE